MKYLVCTLLALSACNLPAIPSASPTPSPIATPVSTPQATPTPTPGIVIPSNATIAANIEQSTTWAGVHDEGTPGTGTASTSLSSSVTRNGKSSRLFSVGYTGLGGVRFHNAFASSATVTHFVYDNYIWISSSSTGKIANLELDMNQVIENGDTVIYGIQCDGYSSTWDYTANTGTPAKPVDTWINSNAPCNPRNWAKDTWNHVQLSFSRDATGNVTYQSFWLNGVESVINKTVPSAFTLGWAKAVLLTNFQIDGGDTAGGTINMYSSGMTVSYW